MTPFEIWQQSECDILGITIDEHNKMIEIASQMEAVGFPDAYDKMKSATNVFSPNKSVKQAGHACSARQKIRQT
jgi:hypothetical protein